MGDNELKLTEDFMKQIENHVEKALEKKCGGCIEPNKARFPLSITNIFAIIVFVFGLAGSHFTNQNRIQYVEHNQKAITSRVDTLTNQVNNQREAFGRLDERLGALQRELAEIKILIQRAIENRNM